MMALLLSFVLLAQNTPPDTATTKPDPTAKVETHAQPKTPMHLTYVVSGIGHLPPGFLKDEEKQLLLAYEQYVQLFLHYDKDAVKNFVTPDFGWGSHKEHEAVSDRSAVQILQDFISGLEVSGTDNMHVTVKKLFIKKDKAVAYVEEKFALNNHIDRDAANKTASTSYTFSYKRKHTWRKTKAGWKLQTMENAD